MRENAKNGTVSLSAKDRAALARLARGTDRLAWRAKGVLLLADGLSKAAVARKLRVGESAVRRWERRWLAGGGADSLRRRGRSPATVRDGEAAAPDLPARIPAAELALLRLKPAGRGRPVSARIAVEAWVRDAAALGLVTPGARLPNQTWFAKRFHAASHTVADAFSALAKQGFVRNRRRVGSFLATTLPFEKRYLLVLTPQNQGLDLSLAAAAREQEGRLGVRWDVRSGASGDGSGPETLPADIAAQRWAGVFLRTSPSTDLPGWEFLHLGRTPISGMIFDLATNGEHVVPLARDPRGGDDFKDGAVDVALDELRAAGRRRPLVIDTVKEEWSGRREAAARRKAAERGLEIPEGCYQQLDVRHGEQIGTILAAAVRVAEWERIDSVAILQDNFAAPVCDALVRRFGADRAARLRIAAFGNRPALPSTGLPIVWHGLDFAATLDTFVAWCDAIHAGEEAPPAPVLATF